MNLIDFMIRELSSSQEDAEGLIRSLQNSKAYIHNHGQEKMKEPSNKWYKHRAPENKPLIALLDDESIAKVIIMSNSRGECMAFFDDDFSQVTGEIVGWMPFPEDE